MYLCLAVAIVTSVIVALGWGDFYQSRTKSDLRWSLFGTYILLLLTMILFVYFLQEL